VPNQEFIFEKKYGVFRLESQNRIYSENISQTHLQREGSFNHICTNIGNLDPIDLKDHTCGGDPVRKSVFISEVYENAERVTFYKPKESLVSIFQNSYSKYTNVYSVPMFQGTLDYIHTINNYTFFPGSLSFETAVFKFSENINVPRSIRLLKSFLVLAGKSEVLTEIGFSEVLALCLGFSLFNGCYFAFQTPGTFTAFINEVINRCPEPTRLEVQPYKSIFLIASPHSPPTVDLGERGTSIFKIVGDRKYIIVSAILSLGAAGFGFAITATACLFRFVASVKTFITSSWRL
jgi:hypothetical protein